MRMFIVYCLLLENLFSSVATSEHAHYVEVEVDSIRFSKNEQKNKFKFLILHNFSTKRHETKKHNEIKLSVCQGSSHLSISTDSHDVEYDERNF